MKLIYRGFFKIDKLPTSILPENAKKFREPTNEIALNLYSLLFTIPCFIIIYFVYTLKLSLYGGEIFVKFYESAILISILLLLPHEILHAICFPKNSEVNLFIMLTGACVACTTPIHKFRFIIMSLLPNIILGVLPLFVWLFFPHSNFSDYIFSISISNLLLGCGDYMNVFNAITQMPKDSMQQLSGMNSYWFIPDDIK